MNYKRAIWGAGVSAVIIGVGVFAVGRLSNGEALQLIDAMLPSTRFLCAAVITATSTILTLILTLISFTSSSGQDISGDYYDRIRLIAKLACSAFIASVVLLLIVNLPLEKAPDKMHTWLWALYYFLLGYSSLLGGVLIATIIVLYDAATSIILIVHPGTDASIIMSKDSNDEEVEEEKQKAEG